MKHFKIGFAGFLIGLMSAAWLHAKGVTETIRAQRIEIVDSKGLARMILQTGPAEHGGAPSITFMDAHGKAELMVTAPYSMQQKMPAGEEIGTGILYRNRKGELVKLMR